MAYYTTQLTGSQFRGGFEPELIDGQPIHVLGYVILPVLLLHVRLQYRVHFLRMGEPEEHQEQNKGADQLKRSALYGHVLGKLYITLKDYHLVNPHKNCTNSQVLGGYCEALKEAPEPACHGCGLSLGPLNTNQFRCAASNKNIDNLRFF